MSGATAAPAAVHSAAEPVGSERVLAGVELAGPAAELAGRLDLAFLTEAGWDPVSRVLTPPAEHPLLGRTVCRVVGCTSTAHGGPTGGVCWRCFTRLGTQGLTGPQIASAAELPSLPDRPAGCAVPGCQRMSPTPRSTLCAKHSRRFRRRPGRSLEQFLTDPGCGRCRRWDPAGSRPAPGQRNPSTAIARPITSDGALRSSPSPTPTSGAGSRPRPRSRRAGRSACGGCHRWWSSRCCSVSSNASRVARRCRT